MFGVAPVNTAVSECVPTVSAEVLVAAVPPETVTGLPRLLAPSLNCTEPAAEDGVTVAVSVTEVPAVTGLAGLAASAVLVVTGAFGSVVVKAVGLVKNIDMVKVPMTLPNASTQLAITGYSPATRVVPRSVAAS